MEQRRPEKALLVASPGGHLLQMLALEPAWSDLDRTWVTLRSTDVEYLLRDEEVIHGHGPTPRNIGNFFRNLRLARRVYRELDPDVIVSTGGGLALRRSGPPRPGAAAANRRPLLPHPAPRAPRLPRARPGRHRLARRRACPAPVETMTS